jgi:hypothetical protein
VIRAAGPIPAFSDMCPGRRVPEVARAIFPICPRYIPKLQLTEPSFYAPRPAYELSEPAWMGFDAFKDVTHSRSRPGRGRPSDSSAVRLAKRKSSIPCLLPPPLAVTANARRPELIGAT